MLFSSIGFLYYFLPFVLFIYFLVPFRYKNAVLLAASLYFYFNGEPVYTLLMLGTIFSAYIHGLLIGRFHGGRLSRVFLVSSVATSLLSLGFFKYSDFFISNINSLFGSGLSLLGLSLPLGISFYTFQTLSYTIDVYRGNVSVQKNPIKLAAYVSMFPQLIAGPIVRYSDVERELTARAHTLADFSAGAGRFCVGLAKKVLLANALGEFVSVFRVSDEKSVVFYWLYAAAFSLQVYFDFSGYSDMAIGLGRIFGFHFNENFNYPFASKSVTEFWRRWHISLGTWFRDYLYIPLGGSRVAPGRLIFNIITVWFLTGFWHGAGWSFIIWGLYFAVLLTAEKLFLKKLLDRIPAALSHAWLLFVIIVGFVIFNGDGAAGSLSDLRAMFCLSRIPFINAFTLYRLKDSAFIFALCALGSFPLLKNALSYARKRDGFARVLNCFEPFSYLLLLALSTAFLVDGSFNPFLYFRF